MRSAPLALAIALSVATTVASNTAAAQTSRAYREGPIVVVTYVRTKPGMFDRYMQYLSTSYKTEMEGEKAAGLVSDYGIMRSEVRGPNDHDVVLTVTYKNWAALDNLADRAAPVANRVLQSTEEQRNQQFADRSAIREIIGSRTYQQLFLK